MINLFDCWRRTDYERNGNCLLHVNELRNCAESDVNYFIYLFLYYFISFQEIVDSDREIVNEKFKNSGIVAKSFKNARKPIKESQRNNVPPPIAFKNRN